MPDVTPLRALHIHNDWARDQLMSIAATLSDAQLDQPFELGPGSLRRTLHHLWHSEQVWLDRWAGNTISDPVDAESMAMDMLWACFRDTAHARDAFLASVGEAGFSKRCTYTRPGGGEFTIPVGDAVLHVINHGFHHRAQLLNMLRHTDGVEPPIGLDYLFMVLDPSRRPDIAYDLDTIAEYLRYGDWARDQVLRIAEHLDDDALDRPFEMSLGTLRKVLLHVRSAEQWWLGAWHGRDTTFESLPETTTIAELCALHEETTAGRHELMAGLSNDDLQREVTVTPRPERELTVRLGDSMIQLGGHGTHHRAQVLNLFRRLGTTSPEIGYRNWCEETSMAGRVG
ncbi:MAG: DinB family protein [Planctomycetota bacterium]|jgi:uncharacterized damage-inducible protein DinB